MWDIIIKSCKAQEKKKKMKNQEEDDDVMEMVQIQGPKDERSEDERERDLNKLKKMLDKRSSDFNRPHPFRPSKRSDVVFAPISPARVRVTVKNDGSGEREVELLDEIKKK